MTNALFPYHPGRFPLHHAIQPVIEQLESRRLLCTLGHVEEGGEPVHLYAAQGEHLNLNSIPDAGTVDIASRSVPLVGPVSLSSDAVVAASGSLNGKVVYMNGGHGWTWGSSWATQRVNNNSLVEDFQTQDQITYYAQYLLNAGATVVATRPLGHQLNEVIVDNNDAGFSTPLGSWSTNTGGSTYWSNVNGTDTANRYRFANVSATETAVARFTPTITNAGWYPVYAWWNNGSNRSTEATYRINSAGGSQEVKVNQRYTGKGWVYLGSYYFEAGSAGNVEVSNKASNGSAVIADAVRFGNGMGDWNSGGGISGKPREEELSLYWAYRSRGYTASGVIVPESMVDGGTTDDADAGVGAPPRWSAYMNDQTQFDPAFAATPSVERVFLSFHSNAFDGSAQGTLALTNNANPTPNQAWWANEIGNEVEEDLQLLPTEHPWASRANTLNGAYGEISSFSAGQEFSTTLLEVAFHDNVQDAQMMRDPKVRDWVARATYQSTVKYFSTFASGSATLIPDPPTGVRATTDAAGNVVLNWTAPGTGSANGGAGAATGYKILTSSTGLGFDNAITLGNVLTYTFTPGSLPAGAMTYFKVVATNAGGDSLQRDVVVAKSQSGRRAPILIVNGFDRNDRTANDTQSYSSGTTERVRLRYQNTRDYVVQFAEAVEAFNPALGVETAQNEQVASGTFNLANYHTVLWISGEESTTDQTFSATERTLLTTFLNNGGKLFVSGAEIGWDLDQNAADPAFYNNLLRADFVNDDAASYTTSGVGGSIFNGLTSIVFDNGADALPAGSFNTYDVETPDVIAVSNGSTAALTYSTGGTAAVQYSSGNTRVVTMGFPFETITTAAKRNSVMSGVLTYFGTSDTLLSQTPGTPDLIEPLGIGSSSTDNKINRNNSSAGTTLEFSVSGTVAGATVTIYNAAIPIGSAVATGTTTTVFTNGTTTLVDGVKSITAKQTEPGKGESAASAALLITIDILVPIATLGGQIPTPGNANFDFTITYADANGLYTATFDSNDVTVTGPDAIPVAASFISAAGNVVTYRIPAPGGAWNLADNGTYTVTQNATQVSDVTGNFRPAGSIGTVNVAVPFAYAIGANLYVDFDGTNQPVTLGQSAGNYAVTQNAVMLTFGGITNVTINTTGGTDTVEYNNAPAATVAFSGGNGLEYLNVTSGTFAASMDLGTGSHDLELTVSPGASATFAAAQHLRRVTINGTGTANAGGLNTIVTEELVMAGSGVLNLNDNDLIIDYTGASPIGSLTGSTYNGVQGLIQSGNNMGAWDGVGLRTGMGDALIGLTTLGVGEASDLLGLGASDTAMFGSETVDATSVIVKYTYAGDANLDGFIDGTDYFFIDSNVTTPGAAGYGNGDFNYDGVIDGTDYFFIDSNIASQGPPL